MYCSSISLTNFRNYTNLQVDLPNGPILVLGPNASGKTTLLEAIYLLATTKSHRAGSDRELINWNAESEEGVPAFARVAAEVRRRSPIQVEITILKESTAQGENVRKRIRVNGVNKRAIDLIGQVNVVMFGPQDLDLIVGAPSLRRRYLNITISQLDHQYVRTLQTYERVVLQRNTLIKALSERAFKLSDESINDQFAYWDNELVNQGSYLLARRLELLSRMNELASMVHSKLTGSSQELSIAYKSTLFDSLPLQLDNPREEEIRDLYIKKIHDLRREELRRGMTLVGPHRDDISFLVGGVDIGVYGSRGQQRSVILAIKLAEVDLMKSITGDLPILLLDDVVSELDPERRRYLLQNVLQLSQQALVTTTDLLTIGREFLAEASLFETTSTGLLQPMKRTWKIGGER